MKAIELYENDKYRIQDAFGEHHQSVRSIKKGFDQSSRVFLADDTDPSMIDIDEKILLNWGTQRKNEPRPL